MSMLQQVYWTETASNDLTDAARTAHQHTYLLQLARRELNHPPVAGPDEDWVPWDQQAMAWRRAIERSIADRIGLGFGIDPFEDTEEFGKYYYIYRKPKSAEIHQARRDGIVPDLTVVRFLTIGQWIGFIGT
ncbi:hypothetical protein [Streptomyces sp. NPDC001388]|uniref:hypothetical protein n=1 Tax=Streptomyces sp. NPDC001388 TaxID=3364568 RepID=UPI00369A6F2B